MHLEIFDKTNMHLEIFLADFAVFRVFLGISRDFAEIPEFRGSATERNIRSPDKYVVIKNTSAWNFSGVEMFPHSLPVSGDR